MWYKKGVRGLRRKARKQKGGVLQNRKGKQRELTRWEQGAWGAPSTVISRQQYYNPLVTTHLTLLLQISNYSRCNLKTKKCV